MSNDKIKNTNIEWPVTIKDKISSVELLFKETLFTSKDIALLFNKEIENEGEKYNIVQIYIKPEEHLIDLVYSNNDYSNEIRKVYNVENYVKNNYYTQVETEDTKISRDDWQLLYEF